jgi:predicted PurR-regulated permease PerM
MLARLFHKAADHRPGASMTAVPAPTSSFREREAANPRSVVPSWIFFPSAVLVIAILYWAQEVLVPIAIAILLTFVLTPIVSALERVHLGRVLSVTIGMALALAILLGAGWFVARQIGGLANELPQYRRNIRAKIADLRDFKRGGALEKVEQTVEDVKSELNKSKPTNGAPPPREVVVAAEGESAFWPIPLATGPMVERLAAVGLALVLVVFMLIQREELRNRLIRILGYSRLSVTTKALEEAGQRISRYLLAQLLLNSGFGIAVALVLSFIGVPYAVLWGFMAIVLRFIPYVGPWLAAIMPTALSLAHFPGWTVPLLVIGAFIILELTTNLVLEPLLYGESAGVSEIAILTMAAFWTWLWGPIGLVLATPLTVCLVVFAKYVPEMAFVTVLLSDLPALEPHVNFYQRMLAGDQDEGEEIVKEYLETHAEAELYDNVLIPALSQAKADRRRGHLSERDEQAVYQETRAMLEEMEERRRETTSYAGDRATGGSEHHPSDRIVGVLGFPADGVADELALLALARILDSGRCTIEVVAADRLASEMVSLVEERRPGLVCIGAITPGGLAHTRYLCKRIRARFPDVKILVGRWGPYGDLEQSRTSLASAGADRITGTLQEARDQLLPLTSLEPSEDRSPPARRAAP